MDYSRSFSKVQGMTPIQSTADLNTSGLRILAKIIARDMLKTSATVEDMTDPASSHSDCTLQKRGVSGKNAKGKVK